MKKVALLFMLAVFVPSLALAVLAARSLRDQQIVAERQQTLLYQGVADALAGDLSAHILERERDFNRTVQELIANRAPLEAATDFDTHLRASWPLAEVGFVVSLAGEVIAPSLFGGPEARKFRLENDRFLCNRETVDVYWNSPKGAINLSKLDSKETKGEDTGKEPDSKTVFATKTSKPIAGSSQKKPASGKPGSEEAEFRQLIADASEGTLARFTQNKLKVMFWYRSSQDPKLVFGAQLNLPKLVEQLRPVVRIDPSLGSDIVAALLDDSGHPVQVSRAGFQTDWKRPFVAAEIGEVLPHWELAVFPVNRASFSQSARSLRLTLGLLIGVLIAAIGSGSWLIVRDLNRQLKLARQKTDFVSNVSHELKTPLTSIRMFSELLAEDRVQAPEKRHQYLQIITAETARLTRLINNVLDFARLDRGDKKYDFERCDIVALTRETVETYRPNLEANGVQLSTIIPAESLFVKGDRDALSQVLVNLISNAEKYGGAQKEISVEIGKRDDLTVEMRILDRGLGVPAGFEEKIFEQFYRAHDSLASGIQGSGLGLTLARQIARAHGGDVRYQPRPNGGSCFALSLPVHPEET